MLSLVSCKREEASKQAASTQATTTAPETISAELVTLNNRGVGLMGRFEYENARLAFEQALRLDERNADVMVNLAIATLNRQHEDDEDRALAILHDVLQLDPHNLRAVYCEGLLRLYLQSSELAQPLFAKVVAADAQDAFAAYYLGQCFAQQRQYDKALQQYRKAIELDAHIRSAYYAASQACRALGQDDEAAKLLTEFQELERKPQAHLAEFKYTRMGPKAKAQTIDAPGDRDAIVKKPDGPVFLDPEPLLSNGEQFTWKAGDPNSDRAVSITACDFDHDGDIDIFIANCLDQDAGGLHNAVCVNDGSGGFALDPDHVLATIPDVNAALWGDVDNDGFTDVYLCRKGPNMLWRCHPSPSRRGAGGEGSRGVPQTSASATRPDAATPSPLTPLPEGEGDRPQWSDITAQAGVDDGTLDSVDGALFDADHDGDLDIFVVNADGPNELFSNNLDGTFKPIAAQAGIAGEGKGSRQVLPVDLDGDRDLDLIVINSALPHVVWINNRAWQYAQTAQSFVWLRATPMLGAVAFDYESDGNPELLLRLEEGMQTWRYREGWECTNLENLVPLRTDSRLIVVADMDGDGVLEGALWNDQGCMVFNPYHNKAIVEISQPNVVPGGGVVFLTESDGASLVSLTPAGPTVARPGPGRYPFAAISFTGKQVTSDNKQVRSNASGIGTHFAARIDSRWVAGSTLRSSSGPGQSLQPVAVGMGDGGHKKIDFLSIDWSDGVFQTEIDLEAGKHHVIEETQRQLSSCPVLFAWDGKHYRFITDLLGVGGIGYLTAPGEYAPSRPWENLLLPANSIQPRDGQFVLKLGEPMEEACYLDVARLVAYDLPPGWDVTVDDRMNIAGPEPSGEAMFYQSDSLRVASRAVNDGGEDVTTALREVDLAAAPVGEVDERFIGLLKNENVVMLSFDCQPADSECALSRKWRGVLLIDGWIEYPYSQTMFAAWQAKATYRAPTLEMRDANGEWKIVYEQFGYPAGMPRQMALPLPGDFAVDEAKPMEMRIRTNQELYFDRIALVFAEECPQARRVELALSEATLADVGFPKRTNAPQRQPHYDYDQRAPLWDARHQRGFYTEFGWVDELIAREDDALAIFGPGEEIELRYDAAALPPLEADWTRRFVLEARGWCKDMDLYTKDGETLEPLPAGDSPPRDAASRDELHRRFNTRYESGK